MMAWMVILQTNFLLHLTYVFFHPVEFEKHRLNFDIITLPHALQFSFKLINLSIFLLLALYE
jgi:hypothetical protein